MTFTEFIRSLSTANPTAWGAMLTVAGLMLIAVMGGFTTEVAEKKERRKRELGKRCGL